MPQIINNKVNITKILILAVITLCSTCQSTVKPESTSINPTSTSTTQKVPVHPTETLPVPNPKYITIQEGDIVDIAWDPVEASEDNPILGIKVKLWEQEKKKVYKFNGTDLVSEWQPVKKSIHSIPHHKPAFEAVLPPEATQTSFSVKQGEEYEIRAQTFNENGDGPLSSATGIMINND